MTHYTGHYEWLRPQAIGTEHDRAGEREAQPPRGIGLALLLREGLPGWLTAVEAVLRAALAEPTPERSFAGRTAPMTLPSAQRHNVTILLASLVLSTRRLTGLSPNEEYRLCP